MWYSAVCYSLNVLRWIFIYIPEIIQMITPLNIFDVGDIILSLFPFCCSVQRYNLWERKWEFFLSFFLSSPPPSEFMHLMELEKKSTESLLNPSIQRGEFNCLKSFCNVDKIKVSFLPITNSVAFIHLYLEIQSHRINIFWWWL